ncbi:MAG: hypothetical protein RLY71_2410 [Pseudomonadota bacterium]|jgi:HEPN domain-containing protein
MADALGFARQLLEAAGRDLTVWVKLVGDTDVHDAMLGFHAQQAVEKYLKAVLALHAVAFRRTHDLAELLDVLDDAGLPSPPHAQVLDELNPFAVEARYGLPDDAGSQLDRAAVGQWLADVAEWAGQQIRNGDADRS